MAQQFERSFE